ncbi:MAG: phosphatase PAP2 family protein [Acidobacteriia bacterium]|nr:phosphatase PAP2 family protein [Terriglobia bacterium]
MPRLRSSEWFLLAYFTYVAIISLFFISSFWKPWILAAVVAAFVLGLARRESWLRDFAPLPLTLAAFEEMNWFTPAVRDHHLEQTWIVWDRVLFDHDAFRAGIESAGSLLPNFFELCYVLVYAAAPVALWALLANGRRDRINHFWLAYLAGTLGAYALFPYFLSDSPRIAFPGENLPTIVTFLRRVNLWIAVNFDIHSSVFPSAHVSSALAAAWGLVEILPTRRWIGWTMAVYGLCVAIATVYGRYHYAADAVAGIAISFLGLAAVRLAGYRNRRGA